jgi:hypothetical protein
MPWSASKRESLIAPEAPQVYPVRDGAVHQILYGAERFNGIGKQPRQAQMRTAPASISQLRPTQNDRAEQGGLILSSS